MSKKEEIFRLYSSGRKRDAYLLSDSKQKWITFNKFCRIMDQGIKPDDQFFDIIPMKKKSKVKVISE